MIAIVACCLHARANHSTDTDPPTCVRCSPEARCHLFKRLEINCASCGLSCLNCGDPDFCCAGCSFLNGAIRLQTDPALIAFIAESNRIEGIVRAPSLAEIATHESLLSLTALSVGDVEKFVRVVAGAPLRRMTAMNVRVDQHVAPRGGPEVEATLHRILGRINRNHTNPYEAHIEYETLHPFMDGNGRSGRAIWAWHMLRRGERPFDLGFLHWWYYASLSAHLR